MHTPWHSIVLSTLLMLPTPRELAGGQSLSRQRSARTRVCRVHPFRGTCFGLGRGFRYGRLSHSIALVRGAEAAGSRVYRLIRIRARFENPYHGASCSGSRCLRWSPAIERPEADWGPRRPLSWRYMLMALRSAVAGEPIYEGSRPAVQIGPTGLRGVYYLSRTYMYNAFRSLKIKRRVCTDQFSA